MPEGKRTSNLIINQIICVIALDRNITVIIIEMCWMLDFFF